MNPSIQHTINVAIAYLLIYSLSLRSPLSQTIKPPRLLDQRYCICHDSVTALRADPINVKSIVYHFAFPLPMHHAHRINGWHRFNLCDNCFYLACLLHRFFYPCNQSVRINQPCHVSSSAFFGFARYGASSKFSISSTCALNTPSATSRKYPLMKMSQNSFGVISNNAPITMH